MRNDFRSDRGLKQHQTQNKACYQKSQAKFADMSGYQTAHEYLDFEPIVRTFGRTDTAFIAQQIALARLPRNAFCPSVSDKISGSALKGALVQKLAETEDFYVTAAEFSSEEENDEQMPIDMDTDEENSVNSEANDAVLANAVAVDCTMRDAFRAYVDKLKQMTNAYTINEENCIKLLIALRHTKASLDTYESIMRWHLACTDKLLCPDLDTLAGVEGYISREVLFKKLTNRYQITEDQGQILRPITLPHSKARPNIVTFDAKNLIIELLTDPRIVDEDYLFFGNDPLQGPPETLNYVADLNTGRAYTETYKKLITKPGKQVLLPVIFYIDGANTGQFSDLPITAVKFTLGIFNRKARDRDFMWKTLGYIPAIAKFKSRGRRLLIDSRHVDSITAHPDALEGEGAEDDLRVNKSQDLHTMLDAVFESYVQLQASGFIWDLQYRNRVYKDLEFVLFTPFMKVDGEEGDKLCAKYTTRTGNVSNLCRYCECPTDRSDDPLADYPYKTTEQIRQMVANNDEDGLRNISQQNIQNACYKLRFGAHDLRGIHGACPVEMLHALLLGVFRYARDNMFELLGVESSHAKDFNGLAQEYGALLGRQSNRDLPKTKFANGITKGKLMAKEYPGVLLCMLCVVVSTEGSRKMLTKKSAFPHETYIKDWILLLEFLLMWEIWLKSDEMQVEHVKRARKKHRYIMYLFRFVAKRAKGMGMKVSKFHAIVHMADDILNFGVPMEFDTGANESGHKATKKAAKLTQRCETTFDSQTAKRLNEMHLLELAEQEFMGNVPWKYFHKSAEKIAIAQPVERSFLIGSSLTIYHDADLDKNVVLNTTRAQDQSKHNLEKAFIEFVCDLQYEIREYGKKCVIRTELRRNGTIFRANVWFQKGVWRDWVLVDWGEEEGHLPCKIWGFVDFGDILPPDSGIVHGQCELQPEVYAIVESSEYLERKGHNEHSELLEPITKVVGGITNNHVTSMTFLLVSVEAFVKPIAVVPDIGGPPNRYFVVKDRSDWAECFTNWLEEDQEFDDLRPHHLE